MAKKKRTFGNHLTVTGKLTKTDEAHFKQLGKNMDRPCFTTANEEIAYTINRDLTAIEIERLAKFLRRENANTFSSLSTTPIWTPEYAILFGYLLNVINGNSPAETGVWKKYEELLTPAELAIVQERFRFYALP